MTITTSELTGSARAPARRGRVVRLCRDDEEVEVIQEASVIKDKVLHLVRTENGFTTQKLQARLEAPLSVVKEAVMQLKESGAIKAVRGGWLKPLLNAAPSPRLAALPAPAVPKTAALPVAPQDGARYAVDDTGNLVISRGAVAIQLGHEEVERLAAFVTRSRPIWRPEA